MPPGCQRCWTACRSRRWNRAWPADTCQRTPASEHQGASAMTSTSRPQAPRYDDVVDLARYPIHDPASTKYRALVQARHDQLRDRGVAQLDGFLTPAAVGDM